MTDTATRPSADRVEEINVPARTVVGMHEHVTVADLPEFFAKAVPATAGELARLGVAPAGPPMVVYRHEADHAFDVTVGFPVENPPASSDVLAVEELPAGRVACAEHVGPYATLPAAYTTMSNWLGERTSCRRPR
ncbi:GyrI-like domain-containing protein [Actinoplanes sp. KI2]|uniref:GyrI-like domain-containing protein n=1 Tax=Actinoplanes sp. KI2 TaxID=2983315 RepID=UPI0021D5C2DD|nr:GyrI-like domain-containing protein [Actinoplanes sp. KI2]MCU7731113.1 GyrI-like domain-containing protein [Actinoplanes sp. KI2]